MSNSVLYTGPENSYPGPFNFGAFTSSWNGKIRNLEPGKSYTISISAISADGVGDTKTISFKVGNSLQSLENLPELLKWVGENTFLTGEGANMSNLLTKFDALETSPHRAYLKVPTSRVTTITATSLIPKACSVVSASAKVDAGLVTALSGDKCTISYSVTGGSRATATLVKDFYFKKYVK